MLIDSLTSITAQNQAASAHAAAISNPAAVATETARLPQPPFLVETPCFVILEDVVRHNLDRTIAGAGGAHRLMPHVKTHRAPWLIEMMVSRGVSAFKAATPAEVELVLSAGGRHVVWAYPTLNRAAVARVIEAARNFPGARVEGLVDSQEGVVLWREILEAGPAANVALRVDLDPGLGRTGIAIGSAAIDLAEAAGDLFAGWHSYDGHIQDTDIAVRRRRVHELGMVLSDFRAAAATRGYDGDLIAAGSYSFHLWPESLVRWVSPGSWAFSSAQHAEELPETGWQIAGYVLSTVLSRRGGVVTLDAGSKAISPDLPAVRRFTGAGSIQFMKEEHSIVETDALAPGDQVALVPRHGCTAAYLYQKAWVLTSDGEWERRPQLGGER